MENLLSSSEWVSAGGLFLVLIGASFLIAEFFIPSFGLFGFAGVTAALIGVIQLHQTGYIEELPVHENIIFGGIFLGVVLSALGGWYSWLLYKKKGTTGIEGMIGEVASVLEWKNQQGRIRIQGEDWQAYSDEAFALKKGDNVIVSEIHGLKIKITLES